MYVNGIRETIKRNMKFDNAKGYNIAVVVPVKPVGGPEQAISKLIRGLSLEGFHVKLIEPYGKTVLDRSLSSIRDAGILREFDVVIYMGSIPLPSYLLIHNHVKTILFVHGYVKDELLNAIKHGNLRVRIGAVLLLGLWSFFRVVDRIDLIICRHRTICEVNGIQENFVLLPEFVFPDEIEAFKELAKRLRKDSWERHNPSKVKMLTYVSYAISPKLLKPQHVEHIVKCVSRHVNRDIELTIINPRKGNKAIRLTENLVVRYLKPMPREVFYRYSLNSDLFIELSIDEELRNSSIEVALLGTPVAKITYPKYRDRLDYPEDIMIHAFSCKDLINKMIEYVNNVEHYRSHYSKKLQEFIGTHRTWDAVKNPLIKHIKDIK